MHLITKTLSFAVVAFALVACGGGGSSSSTTSSTRSGSQSPTFSENIIVTASLGRITNASVTLHNAAFDTIIGSGELNASGAANITAEYNSLEPMIITVTAGESSSYFDEAAGELTLAQGTTFHAIVEEPRNATVTPLTELAWRLAQNQNLLPLNAEQVRRLNRSVSSIFTGGALDITRSPTVLSAMPSPSSMSASNANLYASLLGALATVGEGEAEPMLAVLNALLEDIGDELYMPPMGEEWPYKELAGEFRDALEAWAATYGTDAAKEAVFALPLPNSTFDGRAGQTALARLEDKAWRSRETAVAYSRDGAGEWSDFPVGQALSSVRFGNQIGLVENDEVSFVSAPPTTSTSEFLPDWSLDLLSAELLNVTDIPGSNAIRVAVPTGNADLERYYFFIRREDSDLDSFFLYEDDLTTATKPDRLAHVLNYVASDYFSEFQILQFFNELHNLAQTNTTATVVRSLDADKLCTTPTIGTNNGAYPKAVGLIHSPTEQDVQSLEPQRVRYTQINALADALGDQQREILFGDEMLIRQNVDTGRIDFIIFAQSRQISLWATNHQPLIDTYCP